MKEVDQVDKEILIMLLKNGRATQRSIASKLKMAAPVINYRFNKLIESKVIKRFGLYVNPNFYGHYYGYVSFSNRKDYDGEVIARIKCLEETNVYEVSAPTMSQLEEKIDSLSEQLGEPTMKYIPDQDLHYISKFDSELVKFLQDDPRGRISDISEKMGVSNRTVKRHLSYLESKGYLRVIPIIDISKSNLTVFALFGKKTVELDKITEKCRFNRVVSKNAGIFVCATDSLEKAKMYIDRAREIDEDLKVMITYDYDFY